MPAIKVDIGRHPLGQHSCRAGGRRAETCMTARHRYSAVVSHSAQGVSPARLGCELRFPTDRGVLPGVPGRAWQTARGDGRCHLHPASRTLGILGVTGRSVVLCPCIGWVVVGWWPQGASLVESIAAPAPCMHPRTDCSGASRHHDTAFQRPSVPAGRFLFPLGPRGSRWLNWPGRRLGSRHSGQVRPSGAIIIIVMRRVGAEVAFSPKNPGGSGREWA